MNLRSSEFQAQHDASSRRGRDRIRGKPQNLRTLLRWLTREYGMEPPGGSPTSKMHARGLEEDGDPVMTGETKSWLGMQWPKNGKAAAAVRPDDWTEIACRTDPDGYYVSPMRCTIARINDPQRRRLVAELATNLLFPRAVMDANGIPAWAQNDVALASLSMVWDLWSERPIPRAKWTDLSDSQKAAIVDGETAA